MKQIHHIDWFVFNTNLSIVQRYSDVNKFYVNKHTKKTIRNKTHLSIKQTGTNTP